MKLLLIILMLVSAPISAHASSLNYELMFGKRSKSAHPDWLKDLQSVSPEERGDPRIRLQEKRLRQPAFLLAAPKEVRVFRTPNDQFFLGREKDSLDPRQLSDGLLLEVVSNKIHTRYSAGPSRIYFAGRKLPDLSQRWRLDITSIFPMCREVILRMTPYFAESGSMSSLYMFHLRHYAHMTSDHGANCN